MYIRPNEFVDLIVPAAPPVPRPAPAPPSAMVTIEAAIAIALLAAMIPVMLLYWAGMGVALGVRTAGQGVDRLAALLRGG